MEMESSLQFLPRAVRKKQTVNQTGSISDEQNLLNEKKCQDARGNFEYKPDVGKSGENIVIVSLNEFNNGFAKSDSNSQRKVFIKPYQKPSEFDTSSTQQCGRSIKNESNTAFKSNCSMPTVLKAIENQINPPYRDIGCLSRRKNIAVYKRPRTEHSCSRSNGSRSEHAALHFSNVSWRPHCYNNLEYNHMSLDFEHTYKRKDSSWTCDQTNDRFDRESCNQCDQYQPHESYQSSIPFSHRHSTENSQFYNNRLYQDTGHSGWPFCYPREWEYTEFGQSYLKQTPVSGQLDFTVMSYNILAQNLLEANEYLYSHCYPYMLQWKYRRRCLLTEFKAHRPDILCLQEVNAVHFEDFFKPELEKMGYKGEFVKRTGNNMDGCATFYNSALFALEKAIPIHYKNPEGGEVLDRDNIALILKLIPNHTVQGHSGNLRTLCISNTHLLFNPKRGDVKLAQLMVLLAELDKCGHLNNGSNQDPYHGLIMCGDFNLEPNSNIYQLLAMGRLEYEGLSRKSLSGQEVDYQRSAGPKLQKNFLPTSVGINDSCQYLEMVNERNKKFIALDTENDLITATQGSGCLTHQLKLLSAYTHQIGRFWYEVDEVTTHHGRASCTVDYIFYGIDSAETSFTNTRVCVRNVKESKLKLVGRYGLLSEDELEDMGSLPNDRLGSDHLCLIARFVLE